MTVMVKAHHKFAMMGHSIFYQTLFYQTPPPFVLSYYEI